MTKLRLFLLLAGVISIGVVPLHAGMMTGVVFQFDELGDIQYSIGGNPYVVLPNDSVVESDFTNGVAGNVLVYNLTSVMNTYEMQNGDVPIGGASGLIGDLRFTDANGDLTGDDACGTVECLMIFYVFDSEGHSADVGPVSTSFLTIQTPGTTVSNGLFSYPAGVVTYDGTIVPEPAPAVMLLFGMAAFFFIHKRSKAT
jgi:hypothetical protein